MHVAIYLYLVGRLVLQIISTGYVRAVIINAPRIYLGSRDPIKGTLEGLRLRERRHGLHDSSLSFSNVKVRMLDTV